MVSLMKSICVFCGSSPGFENDFKSASCRLAESMVKRGYSLVYGGGNIGLMGILADEVLSLGGKVTGVIPHFLWEKEVGHGGLTEMVYVNSMHERKTKMSELADAFIAMPGGFGTLEELAEIMTWVQLGLISKPVGILNVTGFYDPLIKQFDIMVTEGFLSTENRKLLLVSPEPDDLINKMEVYRPIFKPKWMSKDET